MEAFGFRSISRGTHTASFYCVVTCLLWCAFASRAVAQDPVPPARPAGIVVIGIDALSTEGLQMAATPNLDTLIRRGALSLRTRAVMPTVSAPNWASMLMGAGPEQHGITKNGWTRATATIEPAARDADGYFPSIFQLVRNQSPGAKTGMFYDWDKLADFFNPKYFDAHTYSEDYHESVRRVSGFIIGQKPLLTFLYIGHADDVGHESGHGTEKYWKAVSDLDAEVGRLLSDLKKAGMFDSLLFFVITDHGGVGNGHGGESMAEIEVPWIVSGPGTVRDRLLAKPNNSLNTASTIAWVLGLKQPDAWIGRPVTEAFESTPGGASYVARPLVSVRPGVYFESQRVTISSRDRDAAIRYTTDGSEPGIGSPVYRDPIVIDSPAVVKAVAVTGRGISSVSGSEIRVIRGMKGVRLRTEPSEKYAAGGAPALIDGVRGSERYNDGRWAGFEGVDMDLVIDFGSPRTVNGVSIGCLNDTASWIFLPVAAEFYGSADGGNFAPVKQGASDLMKMRNSLTGSQTFTVSPQGFRDRYLRVVVKNLGTCPPGHSAGGKKAWLFVDEVIIQ